MADQHNDYDADLISIVTHELKTPVGAIKGFLDLVEHAGELNETQMQFLSKAQIALTRMEQLIAGILHYTKISAGVALTRTEVDLNALVANAYKHLKDIADQRSVVIHVPEKTEPAIVLADKQLLEHVLTNLLSNAIKYNKKSGEVWVTVQKQDDAAVRVDVKDNGIGISPHAQTQVFKQFYRAVKKNENGKIEGSGLGLAICQSIVEMHQGRIWVESELEQGSTFSFTIPSQPKSAPESAPESAREPVKDESPSPED